MGNTQCKKVGKRRSKHSSNILLAIILLFSSVIAVFGAAYQASAADFSIVSGSRVVDPDTSAETGFLDIPWLHDGRVWADKSVTVGANTDDFDVTLSALSQASTIMDGYIVPADIVFVIDVSGSMQASENYIDGRPRIAVLVDALNEAIGILLDANPENRVAVVAYGGNSGGFSRAENVLPLGRPELRDGATNFFTYRRDTAPSPDEHFVDVNTTNRQTDSVLVDGSTPIQRGILLGADILTSATDLTIPALSATGDPVFQNDGVTPLMVTRKPNIILMTDGEPTMAWDDYLFENTTPDNNNHTYGDGSFGETGISLLTILTAAHRKQLVQDAYFANNPDHAGAVNNDATTAGFYTVSLNDVPPPDLIAATMFPFNPTNPGANGNADAAEPYLLNVGNLGGVYLGDPSDPSVGALLRDFLTNSITFDIQRRDAWLDYEWDELSISNAAGLSLQDLAYSDLFFPANDLNTLSSAFESITTNIQAVSFGDITVTDPDYADFDGYLIFSDVLGEYMEFRGVKDLEFDGVSYSRSGVAAGIAGADRAEFESILYNQMNYGNLPNSPDFDADRFVSTAQITDLVQSNIDSGYLAANNSLKYYAKSNRDFITSFWNSDGSEAARPADAAVTVELLPMWGDIGTPVITQGQTDLLYIMLHVVTVLDDNTVLEELFDTGVSDDLLDRSLNAGDQLVRWYIPASLIPRRHVDHASGALTGNTQPVRVHYTVGLDQERVAAGLSDEYIAAHTVPNTDNSVYFYANQDPNNVTLSFYRPHADNPYYQTGRPGRDGLTMKSANPTATAEQVALNLPFLNDSEQQIMAHHLGNNGRLAISFDEPLPETETPPPLTPEAPNTGSGTDGTTTQLLIVIFLSSIAIVAGLLWTQRRTTHS